MKLLRYHQNQTQLPSRVIVVQLLTHAQLFATSWPAACQAPLFSTVSWSQWCHLTTSCSAAPFSLCSQSFPAAGSFPASQFFASGRKTIGALASTTVLPMNVQAWFPLGWTLCNLKDSQESSLAAQFESINSLVLSFLYGPTLTSAHDYKKNHSFD